MTTTLRRMPALLLGATLLACTEPTTPVMDDSLSLQESRAGDRCINVDLSVLAQLGPWMLNGVVVPGAAPAPVTLGGIDGWLASVLHVDGMRAAGNSGTVHWTLNHYFVSDAPTSIDLGGGFIVQAVDLSAQSWYFSTEDRAVCAAAGSDPLSCRVSDHMTIRGGSGMFDNANGFLHNQGMITLVDPALGIGTGDFRLRGRICGDGL